MTFLIDHWNQIWGKRSIPKDKNEFATKIVEYIPTPYEKIKLLDVGSGNGADSVYFHDLGVNVTSLDISEVGLKQIKSLRPNVKTVCSSIVEIDLLKDHFDVVYAHLSLHYFTKKETSVVFQKLRDTLKPGGVFFVKCKSVNDPLYGKGEKVESDMFHHKHTRHFFSAEYLEEVLRSSGFSDFKISETNSVYHEYESCFVEAVVFN